MIPAHRLCLFALLLLPLTTLAQSRPPPLYDVEVVVFAYTSSSPALPFAPLKRPSPASWDGSNRPNSTSSSSPPAPPRAPRPML